MNISDLEHLENSTKTDEVVGAGIWSFLPAPKSSTTEVVAVADATVKGKGPGTRQTFAVTDTTVKTVSLPLGYGFPQY